MKEQQMVEAIKARLGNDQFTYTFDTETNRLRLQHKKTERGMEIAISQVVAKYQEKQQAAIDEVVYTVQQTFAAMTQEAVEGFVGKNTIYPVVRSTSFPQKSKEGNTFLTTEHTAETRIFYALDLGNTYRLIDESMLPELALSAQQVKEAARFALGGLGTDVKRDEVAGSIFYFVNYNDGYDASRILNEKFLQQMREKIQGDMTLSVPHQDVLIIGDIRDEVGYDVLAQLTMHYFSVGMVPITSLSFVYDNGELEPIFILAKNKNTKGAKE